MTVHYGPPSTHVHGPVQFTSNQGPLRFLVYSGPWWQSTTVHRPLMSTVQSNSPQIRVHLGSWCTLVHGSLYSSWTTPVHDPLKSTRVHSSVQFTWGQHPVHYPLQSTFHSSPPQSKVHSRLWSTPVQVLFQTTVHLSAGVHSGHPLSTVHGWLQSTVHFSLWTTVQSPFQFVVQFSIVVVVVVIFIFNTQISTTNKKWIVCADCRGLPEKPYGLSKLAAL